MIKHKALQGVEIKDAALGTVEAVFSTFNVKDSDGDVTLPGAFEDGAAVRISAYGHASWGPSRGASLVPMPPIGKGILRTTSDEAILQGQFFLKTQAGADTFELVKEMGDLQEWSYGYDVNESEKGKHEGESVRFLKSLVVHEVSPVLLGAGVGTRTLAVKGKQLDSDLRAALDSAGRERFGGEDIWVYVDDFDLDAGFAIYSISASDAEARYVQVDYERGEDGAISLADEETEVRRTVDFVPKSRPALSDHVEGALGGARDVIDRVKTFGSQATGQKEGRTLSAANRERLASLAEALGASAKEIETLLTESDPNKSRGELQREFFRYQHIAARI